MTRNRTDSTTRTIRKKSRFLFRQGSRTHPLDGLIPGRILESPDSGRGKRSRHGRLLPMLKDAGLCLMECVFLMLRSDACKLFPVLCRLFPEVEEMFEIITWNDREYFVRELTLFRGTGGEYKTLVSVTGLQDVLVGKDGAPISDEAEAVDRKICYYFTDEEFLLPEERLVALAEDA